MSDAPSFSGFPKDALPFLKALGFHQNREWFHENKPIYESAVKQPLGDLVETVAAQLAERGVPLTGSRKTSLYRVNRDVRFAKNKDPYNTHASALMTRSGTKKDNGFLYMHFSNERSFIASGFYAMESDELRAFRELILREPEKMKRLCDDLEKHGLTLDLSESLKRNPRGFEDIEDERLRTWIRLKHFTFIDELDNADLTKGDLADRLVNLGELSVPFLEFGWRAIDPVRANSDDRVGA